MLLVPMSLDLAALTGILAALGVGGILAKLVEGIIAHATGQHDRETARVQRIIDARDRAEQQRDAADRRRRIITEHAHQLRLQLIEAGITPPPFPPTTPDKE